MTTELELEKARIALALARVAAELLEPDARRPTQQAARDVESLAERLYHVADWEGFTEAPGDPADDPIWGPS